MKTRLIRPTPRAMTDNFSYPDGSCMDAERNLWNSRYGGGVDRAKLYATTAMIDLDEAALTNPREGALPALEPGNTGISNSHFEV